MKMHVSLLLLLGSMSLYALIQKDQFGNTVYPPKDGDNDTGYMIPNYSKPEDVKIAQDVKTCKAKCDANVVKAGSKVPCKSKKYPLLRLCYESCDQAAGWEKIRKTDSNGAPVKPPLYGWSTMYVNCLKKVHEKEGWPFRCASIYCALVDPEDKDTMTRNLAVLDKETMFKPDVRDDQEALPEHFQDGASEF